MITIIDYGMGNLGSIKNMFKRAGFESIVTNDPEVIFKAKKLILPGVGSFDHAINKINELKFRELLDKKALQEKVPILGICLGMQLLTRSSEEGVLPGLGWIPAITKRFEDKPGLKIPHMGWNVVRHSTASKLTEGYDGEIRFYFVHSYRVIVDDIKYSIFKTTYNVEFDSAIQNDNIFGVQFHPEKSHRFGLQLLTNFAKL